MSTGDPQGSSPVIATLMVADPLQPADTARSPEQGSSTIGSSTPENVSVVQLREGMTIRVGRAKNNDLALNNRNVSRFHAVFSASSTGVVLSDLSSLNGTFVNGNRIATPVDLGSGDVVTIGDTTIAVKISHGEASDGESVHGRTQTAQLAAVVVTVLVVDVCGYTKMSEALPPNDVASMLHQWFQQISEIVTRNGGTVDKYIGDCVMSLWRGSHDTAGAQARMAVEAAVQMMRTTKSLSEGGQWSHHDKNPWTCRVALNTGEALMGTVGGAGRRDFTVLGDTVNVAFRLEGVASKLQSDFVLSAATAEHVKEHYPLRNLGEVNVEGRRGHISVFSYDAWAG